MVKSLNKQIGQQMWEEVCPQTLPLEDPYAGRTYVAISDRVMGKHDVLKHIINIVKTNNFTPVEYYDIANIIVTLDDSDKKTFCSRHKSLGGKVVTYPDFVGSSED